jgi:hypothetical protein
MILKKKFSMLPSPLVRASFLAPACLLAFTSTASAYVGPGVGLSMFGTAIALIATVLIALVGLVLWPIHLLKKGKQDKAGGNG